MVYLVGAGPGDPGLITVKGLECIKKSEVIVYDRLVSPRLLTHTRSDAELIYVGKQSSAHTLRQGEINQLLVDKAREGKTVCRLKGGDPFVFGRGGEEAEALVMAGLPFEIVPGVTSAVSGPAYAGIPVTHRTVSSSLGIITGHEDPEKTESSIAWDKISTGLDTLVFLMGVENLPSIVGQLVKHGRSVKTPIALIRWATLPRQETLVGTLNTIVDLVRQSDFKPPALIVVGDVINLRDQLRWFDNRPLFGKRILVTRAREQASVFAEKLEELGAEALEFPVIKIAPPQSYDALDAAIQQLSHYDWIIFTSVNGVDALVNRLRFHGLDIRALGTAKLCAIGPQTAGRLEQFALSIDLLPKEYVAESILDSLDQEEVRGKRFLLPRAEVSREVLPEKLVEKGAIVDVVPAYRTELDDSDAEPIREMLRAGEIDAVTFTSSSTVHNFCHRLGEQFATELLQKVCVACIGPVTAETARQKGIAVSVIAEEYTIDGLVEALVKRET